MGKAGFILCWLVCTIAFGIGCSGILLVVDAIGHFVRWEPYYGFPWDFLRGGFGAGSTASLIYTSIQQWDLRHG